MSQIEGMEAVVDRIEEEIVVLELENEQMIQCSRSEVPDEIKEGYVLRMKDGTWEIDMEAYERKKAEIEELMQNFF